MKRGALIGIAGGSASGKTLVAQRLYEELGSDKVLILKQDSYYKDLGHLPLRERRAHNFDHPDAFDTELLIRHLAMLLEGGEVDMPIYDFRRHVRSRKTSKVGGYEILVLEGILVLDDPTLREMMDIKVYIDTDADIRLTRRISRDVHERGRTVQDVLDQYEESVRPMHLQFVEPSKRYADIIIPEGGHNWVAIDLLKTKIEAVLASRAMSTERGRRR